MVGVLSLLGLAAAVSAAPSSVVTTELFKRNDWLNGTAIGSDEWKALYPATNVTAANPAQAWLDTLKAVEAAGLIPDVSVNPIATLNATSGSAYYDASFNATDPGICSVAFGCFAPTDVVNAPDGKLTIAFDDGPDKGSPSLYSFLSSSSIPGTHFLIGRQIIAQWQLALSLRDIKAQQLAVHTWTHQHMTTLTNEEVVAELGWTMQLIADLNYGKIPGWWRPPYGDVDNRVRAIARHVFGLQTVIWNQDPKDWAIDHKTYFESDARARIQQYVNGTKSPGLLMLEHELSVESADAFIKEYPTFKEKGWEVNNIPSVFALPWYKNAFDDGSYVDTSVPVEGGNNTLSFGTTGDTEPY